MQSLILFLALVMSIFSGFSTWSGNAEAAPAMKHTECQIIGTFQGMEPRVEERNKSWAKSWGIPDSYTYQDASFVVADVQVTDADGFDNCQDKLGEHIFQIRSDWQDWFRDLATGSCIKGLSRVSGDEFSFGDWLFTVETIAADACD